MPNIFTRTFANLREADRHRRDALHLAALPDYLLRDMGLRPSSPSSLVRQIRGK